MLNGVRRYRETDGTVRWLIKDRRGLIGLPIWINRQTTQGTFQRFSFSPELTNDCWVDILPPVEPEKSAKQKTKTKGK